MDAGLDWAALKPFGGDVPQMPVQRHVQHLVEIAIVKAAAVINAQGVAAHEAIDGGGIEVVGEQFEITVPLVLLAQILSKAGDGLIRNRVKMVENDAVVALKGFLVVSLQFHLRRREGGADGIVNEV